MHDVCRDVREIAKDRAIDRAGLGHGHDAVEEVAELSGGLDAQKDGGLREAFARVLLPEREDAVALLLASVDDAGHLLGRLQEIEEDDAVAVRDVVWLDLGELDRPVGAVELGVSTRDPELKYTQEMVDVERLYDEAISALVDGLRDVGDVVLRGQHQNGQGRQLRTRPDVATDLVSVDVRHHDVQENEIGALLLQDVERLLPTRCQGKALFYAVTAWEDDFTGYVIDYGTYPDQRRGYFTLRDITRTLGRAAPGAGLEGAIYAGLEKLTGDYLSREWRRDDGAVLKIERCLIDANWGTSTDVVYQFCRQSAHATVLLPSHGRFVGASSIPFSEYKRKRGDRVGLNWRIPNVAGRRAVRHVVFDANYWKSFVHARLAVPMGDKGCLSLFGRKPAEHQLFAEHVTAEYRVRTEARGRVVDEWKLRAGNPDNHWLDCLVGCAVAASIQGAILPGTDAKAPPRRERMKLSDLQRRRR